MNVSTAVLFWRLPTSIILTFMYQLFSSSGCHRNQLCVRRGELYPTGWFVFWSWCIAVIVLGLFPGLGIWVCNQSVSCNFQLVLTWVSFGWATCRSCASPGLRDWVSYENGQCLLYVCPNSGRVCDTYDCISWRKPEYGEVKCAVVYSTRWCRLKCM